jgi:hypothetical protein
MTKKEKKKDKNKNKKAVFSEISNKIEISILSHELWHCWTGCHKDS